MFGYVTVTSSCVLASTRRTPRLTFPTPCVKKLARIRACFILNLQIKKIRINFCVSYLLRTCFVYTLEQNVSTLVQIHFIKCVNIFVLVSYSNYKDGYTKVSRVFRKKATSSFGALAKASINSFFKRIIGWTMKKKHLLSTMYRKKIVLPPPKNAK